MLFPTYSTHFSEFYSKNLKLSLLPFQPLKLICHQNTLVYFKSHGPILTILISKFWTNNPYQILVLLPSFIDIWEFISFPFFCETYISNAPPISVFFKISFNVSFFLLDKQKWEHWWEVFSFTTCMKITHVYAWRPDHWFLFPVYTQESQELSGYDPSWEIPFALIYLYLS